MEKIRLLLADDHGVLRAGLRTLFEAQPDMEVVAEAANGGETVHQCVEIDPDVVLLDITMPGMNGLKAASEIKRQNPKIKILVLTMHEDELYLHQAFRAGVDGYIPKKAADTELLDAIRATHRGEHFIHSSMTAGLLPDLHDEQAASPVRHEPEGDGLSERELEVLKLLALGHTDQEIADTLYLSPKTVATYKARLKDKLDLRGRAELVRYAIQHGLLDTDD